MPKSWGFFFVYVSRIFLKSAKDLTVGNDWICFANSSYKPTLLCCAP